MQFHQLQSIKQRPKARVGRGGKRGTTAGRGTKGQKARAGHRIRPAERDLVLRLPKKRGFRNKPKSEKPLILSIGAFLSRLEHLRSGKKELIVSRNTLVQLGFVPAGYRGEIKILGRGELKSAVTFKGLRVSAGIKRRIEKSGGKLVK